MTAPSLIAALGVCMAVPYCQSNSVDAIQGF